MGLLNTARDIFFYQLGAMRDAERSGGLLLATLADRVADPRTAELLREQAQESNNALGGVAACLEELQIAPISRRSEIVEGMLREFEHIVALKPTPESMALFAVAAALQYLYFAIGTYQGLLDWTEIIGEKTCHRWAAASLSAKQGGAERLAQVGRELSHTMFTTSPGARSS